MAQLELVLSSVVLEMSVLFWLVREAVVGDTSVGAAVVGSVEVGRDFVTY